MPRFFNKIYLQFELGDNFGETDLGQDKQFTEQLKNDKKITFFDKDQLVRRFTTLAIGNCDLLTLSIRDLLKMKLEFPKVFGQFFKDAYKRFCH